MEIKEKGELIFLDIPYIPELPKKLRNMGGNWDGSYWIFRNNAIIKKSLTDFLSKFFGFKIGSHTGIAIVTVLEQLIADRESVCFKGFILANARGRDTGAKTSESVTLLSGEIGSGGSVKNLYSYVDKGTKFLIENFPTEFIEDKKFSVEFQTFEIPAVAERGKDFSEFTDKELINELMKRNYVVQKI